MLRLHAPHPSEPAGAWIQLIWEWEGYRSPAPLERILPHGEAEISWNLSAPHRFQDAKGQTSVAHAALVGPRGSPYLVDTRSSAHLFGVVFRPGAAAALLEVSLAEIGPSLLPLRDTRAGAELEGRIAEARSAIQRTEVVRRYFAERSKFPRSREANYLLSAWSGDDGRQRSIASIRDALGLSAPTFVDRIRRQVGLRPAELRQILMFRDAVRALAQGDRSLTEAAHEAGYCDQAHLNRAFRRHAELTPGGFRPWMKEHPFNLPEFSPALSFDPRRSGAGPARSSSCQQNSPTTSPSPSTDASPTPMGAMTAS
ncbi:MAG: helix-turn-helix domain-containing protein [Myxococcota bacterium]